MKPRSQWVPQYFRTMPELFFWNGLEEKRKYPFFLGPIGQLNQTQDSYYHHCSSFVELDNLREARSATIPNYHPWLFGIQSTNSIAY